MGKYLDKTGLTYYHGLLLNLFSKKGHTHTIKVGTGVSGTKDTATLSIPNISKKTVVVDGTKTAIPNISVAAASTDTVDGVKTWATNTPTEVTLPTLTTYNETLVDGFTANTPSSFSVSSDVLNITTGTAASVHTDYYKTINTWSAGSVTAGSAAALTTESKTFTTDATKATAGTAIEAYTSLTTGDSITVGTPTSQGVVTDATFNTVVTSIAGSSGTDKSTSADVDPS